MSSTGANWSTPKVDVFEKIIMLIFAFQSRSMSHSFFYSEQV